MKRDTIIVVYGWRFKVVFAFYAKPSQTPPSLIIIRSIVKHRQHVCEGGGGLIWVLLIAAPHRAAGSHPEQELSHASLGGVRGGQGRNADNTTLGTMVTRTRSMQGTHCMQTLQVCCSHHSPSVERWPGVGQIIFIPACVPEYSAPASSIHHVNSAHVC